jgi:hypothetical protein
MTAIQTPAQGRLFPDNQALLQHLYADVTRISQVSTNDIILHTADRDLSSPPRPPLRGKTAAQAHEDALVALTQGTLVMDVQTIVANEHFGTAMGILRARKEGRGDLAIPFCGVWRFEKGLAVEHWENAVDARALEAWLSS